MAGITGFHASAQESPAGTVRTDSVIADTSGTDHSPKKAAILSAVFPGMGQVYNGKYWKLPIVYGGIGGLVYGSVWNSRHYRTYFDKYKYMTENDLDEYEGQSIRVVEGYKNYYLRNKNLFIILTAGFYGLQIIDANVDAHLFDYDISEDLSLRIDPVLTGPFAAGQGHGSPPIGIRCCLSF